MASTARAAEVASNGVGGGAWTDPATWRAKKAPTADDDVVIQKNDVVTFDRQGDGKPTCRKLLIDPKGGLTFKTGGGKLVLTVTEGVESFGAIRLDGTKSAADDFALHLVGESPKQRLVKLGKGGALLLYGRANLPDGRRNVTLAAPPGKEPLPGLVEAEGAVMVDWLRANVQDVKLFAKTIDNTGAKPNERVKIAECNFSGVSRLWIQGCDTPEVVKNTFEHKAAKPIEEPAVMLHSSPLADLKDNTIRGGFAIGISLAFGTEVVAINNTVEKCGIGLNGGYGVPNAMIKQLTVRGCETGVKLEGATGVLEELTVAGATVAYKQENSKLQLNHFRVKDLAAKGTAVQLDGGIVTLLNCELTPEQVKVVPQKPIAGKPPQVPVTCLHYVTVGVKNAPAGALVELRTTTAAAGAADPNVRNSPAAVIDGLTPLPKTLTPLIVKSWSCDLTGKLVAAPEYTLKVLGPAAKEGADRPVLATRPFRPLPAAFRAMPNDKTPSLEVVLK